MCHFLTIAVPGKSVQEVPKEFRRTIHFAEHTNPSVTCHTPSVWTSFTAISEGCSCNLYRSASSTSEDKSKLEKKYRKKGWSASKIQRALESHEFSPTPSAGLRDDVVSLVAVLAKTFGEIRLSLHWYSGDVETEEFTLKDGGCISLQKFLDDTTELGDETTIKIQAKKNEK
jgi:Tat protein secretion system quality control protein TatD with DNase activity